MKSIQAVRNRIGHLRDIVMRILFAVCLSLFVHSQCFASTLSDAAASLAPGQWGIITPNNIATIDREAGLLTSYADSAAWDQANKRLLFIGSDHAVGYTFAIWNDSTNAWSNGPSMSSPNIPFSTLYVGHAFDGNTYDQYGNYYYRVRRGTVSGNHDVYKYSASTSTWTNLPDNNMAGVEGDNCCQGIAYFPEMNGLIWVSTAGRVFLFNDNTQAWSQIASVSLSGGTWTFVEYNPVKKVVIFGSGASDRLFVINSSGIVTQKNNIPISLYDGTGFSGQVTVDPVSGTFIMLTGGSRTCHTYAVDTDTWGTCTNPPSALQGSALAAAPISTYGVTAFISCGPSTGVCDGKIYLYKHSNSVPNPTQPPLSPASLDVR
jgi:hypothetical protein